MPKLSGKFYTLAEIYEKNKGLATDEEFVGAKEIKPKKSKSKLKKDIKDTIKMVESTKKPKKTKTKNISEAIELVQMMAKEPKYNNKKNTKTLQDSKAEVDLLFSSSKKEPKKSIMKISEGYVHKVKDISPATNNYVNAFKVIVSEGKTASSISKNLNKLKLDLYTKLRPSDITDAHKLINDFMMSLPSKEKKTYKKKEKEVDTSYRGDKKYKPMVAYLKKHKPEITDPEDIHTIVSMIIEAKVPRMSVKKLNEIMEE